MSVNECDACSPDQPVQRTSRSIHEVREVVRKELTLELPPLTSRGRSHQPKRRLKGDPIPCCLNIGDDVALSKSTPRLFPNGTSSRVRVRVAQL
jgi:hypothetical protein